MQKKIVFILLLVFLTVYIHGKASAQVKKASLPTVTIINPIRGHQLGLEDSDLLSSLKGQWKATKSFDISATWLWQYSALEDNQLVDFAKQNMKNQEYGIFLEIDKNFAEKSGVRYRGKGPWYFSDGLFLTSYEREDREKLITKVFEKFKDKFGYYPKTVGAWWVGADSINYMQKKYGITGVLQCADQFNTDKYSIWGTPWSIPYKPSSLNSAIPARDQDESKVVIMQWATRDPLKAYGNSVTDSTYSIQDLTSKGYNVNSYMEYLRNIYLHKEHDQIVVGLESGLAGPAYDAFYRDAMQTASEWQKKGEVKLQTARQFSENFLETKQIFSPTSYFLTKGYHTNDQAFWYQSPYYRIGIEKKGNIVYLIDVRNYLNTAEEDFYRLPNTQPLIRINTNSVIDSVRFPTQRIKLADTTNPLMVNYSGNEIRLMNSNVMLAAFKENSVVVYNLNENAKASLPENFKNFGNSSSVTFSRPIKQIPIYGLITLIVFLYLYFLIVNKTKAINSKICLFCFVFNILLFYPIFTNGQFFSSTIEFNRVGLLLSPLLTLFSTYPEIRVILIYQLIPVSFIIILNFFLSRKIKRMPVIVGIYFLLGLICTAYFNNYSFFNFDFLSHGRRFLLFSGFVFFVLAITVVIIIKLFRKKKDNLLVKMFVVLCLIVVWLIKQDIINRRSAIITPFEIEALNKVYSEHKNISYLTSAFDIENYQSTIPILATDKRYAEYLTSTRWQKISSVKNADRELLFIPRYFHTDTEEEKIIGKKKIFDNAQIAIYE